MAKALRRAGQPAIRDSCPRAWTARGPRRVFGLDFVDPARRSFCSDIFAPRSAKKSTLKVRPRGTKFDAWGRKHLVRKFVASNLRNADQDSLGESKPRFCNPVGAVFGQDQGACCDVARPGRAVGRGTTGSGTQTQKVIDLDDSPNSQKKVAGLRTTNSL